MNREALLSAVAHEDIKSLMDWLDKEQFDDIFKCMPKLKYFYQDCYKNNQNDKKNLSAFLLHSFKVLCVILEIEEICNCTKMRNHKIDIRLMKELGYKYGHFGIFKPLELLSPENETEYINNIENLCERFDYIINKIDIKFAYLCALIHDVGKTVPNKDGSYGGHERKGGDIVKQFTAQNEIIINNNETLTSENIKDILWAINIYHNLIGKIYLGEFVSSYLENIALDIALYNIFRFEHKKILFLNLLLIISLSDVGGTGKKGFITNFLISKYISYIELMSNMDIERLIENEVRESKWRINILLSSNDLNFDANIRIDKNYYYNMFYRKALGTYPEKEIIKNLILMNQQIDFWYSRVFFHLFAWFNYIDWNNPYNIELSNHSHQVSSEFISFLFCLSNVIYKISGYDLQKKFTVDFSDSFVTTEALRNIIEGLIKGQKINKNFFKEYLDKHTYYNHTNPTIIKVLLV